MALGKLTLVIELGKVGTVRLVRGTVDIGAAPVIQQYAFNPEGGGILIDCPVPIVSDDLLVHRYRFEIAAERREPKQE